MYTVFWKDPYELATGENEYSTLEEARSAAQRIDEDWGDTLIIDDDGNEYAVW